MYKNAQLNITEYTIQEKTVHYTIVSHIGSILFCMSRWNTENTQNDYKGIQHEADFKNCVI